MLYYNSNIKIKFKKLNSKAIIPTLGTPNSACYDLYSIEDININPNQTVLVPHGFALEIENNPTLHLQVLSRSGLALKLNLALLSTGMIDNDYRGELKSLLHNFSDKPIFLKAGEKISQLAIQEFYPVIFEESDYLSETVRGICGFGSTDKKNV